MRSVALRGRLAPAGGQCGYSPGIKSNFALPPDPVDTFSDQLLQSFSAREQGRAKAIRPVVLQRRRRRWPASPRLNLERGAGLDPVTTWPKQRVSGKELRVNLVFF